MRAELIAVFLGLALQARAQQTNVGSAAAEFLRLGAGARAMGMGNAYTAVAEGAEASYWNPAGLSSLNASEFSYTHAEFSAGLHYDFLAVAAPLPRSLDVMAVSYVRLSQESLALVDASDQNHGSFSPYSQAVGVSLGYKITENDSLIDPREHKQGRWNILGAERPQLDDDDGNQLSVGASAKFIQENLGTREAETFAGDAGLLFRPANLHELALAAAVRNVGGRLNFISDSEILPSELAFAASYDIRSDQWRLLPSLEADVPYSGQVEGKLGFEASHQVAKELWAAVRLGYDSSSVPDLGALSGLTTGVGLSAGPFSFDAAFQPLAVLGETFRLSVDWRF